MIPSTHLLHHHDNFDWKEHMNLIMVVLQIILIAAQAIGVIGIIKKSFPKLPIEVKSMFLFSGINSLSISFLLPEKGVIDILPIFKVAINVGIFGSIGIGVFCLGSLFFLDWVGVEEGGINSSPINSRTKNRAIYSFFLSLGFFWVTLLGEWGSRIF